MRGSRDWMSVPPQVQQRAIALLDEGRKTLRAHDPEKARAHFARAVELCPMPAALNNLAAVVYQYDRDPTRALQILAPNLKVTDGSPQPFAYSLAAQCLTALGRADAARTHLERAVTELDRGLKGALQPWQGAVETLVEHTPLLIRAAGELGDHEWAWSIYQRWESVHSVPMSFYYGGVAACNLGRYAEAAEAWLSVPQDKWPELHELAAIIRLGQYGLLPPLSLPYEPSDLTPYRKSMERVAAAESSLDEAVRVLFGQPVDFLYLLAKCLAPVSGKVTHRQEVLLASIVRSTTDWGSELARRVLRAPEVSLNLKFAVARGWVLSHEVTAPESFRLNISHAEEPLESGEYQLILEEDNPAKRRRTVAALRAARAGQPRRAIESLDRIIRRERILWVPTLLAYAELLQEAGLQVLALQWAELADRIIPNSPPILLRLAECHAARGHHDMAREVVARIKPDELHDTLIHRLNRLQASLSGHS